MFLTNNYFLLVAITALNILGCCPSSKSQKSSSSKSQKSNKTESDKCKFEILFDNEFLVNKDVIIKNKEIENCYLSVKNGAEHKKGRTPDLGSDAKFFNINFYNMLLMRVYEVDDKLNFVKVTKDNIEENAIYFLGALEYNLNFVIFKDINKALEINRQYKLIGYTELEECIKNLLS